MTAQGHRPKWIILGLIGLLIIGVCSWWGATTFIESQKTYPLGDRLEYLGKEDYGCWVGFCDYTPYSVYYYGTDILPEEIVGYFKGMTLKYPIENNGQYTDISLVKDETSLLLTYKSTSRFKTSKKYIISIVDSQYDIAKKHLMRT